jgi:hypothetical protein
MTLERRLHWSGKNSQRKEVFFLAVEEIAYGFVDIPVPAPTSSVETDHVRSYTREVMSLELLFLEFSDAIWEGDGFWILRCWRFFLPFFKATKCTNYSAEAFTMLAQYQVFQ